MKIEIITGKDNSPVAEYFSSSTPETDAAKWQIKTAGDPNPKIAIYVDGGIVQAIRSNISPEIEIEIVDCDNEPDTAEDRWEEIQEELEHGNY